MGKRPISFPLQQTDALKESAEWENLKNRFSGKTLFRLNLYHLETGNLSVLDLINNRWFLEELFTYALIKHDINLIPALKKIAGAGRFDESIRQRASEIVEIIEEDTIKKENREKSAAAGIEEEKIENARKMIAGIRYPQTTEVLKLLRDKSIELKRLALFLIGKFKMTDMVQEVCDCLNTAGLKDDAFSVLVTFGKAVSKEINSFYLVSSGNISLSKAILRLFAKTCPKENMSFIVERLWSNSRQLKELALTSLISCGYRANEDQKEHLHKVINETFGTIAWIISAKVCLHGNNPMLLQEFEKEYNRWKAYLRNLLILTFDNAEITLNKKEQNKRKDNLRYIPALVEIIFGDSIKPLKENIPDAAADKKRLKKLQRYFQCGQPRYDDLLEEIINCDYNLLSIWTKACALRNIRNIENENLGESVVALLFSPDELLQEEASKLIGRTSRELYHIASERIPETERKKLDKIISDETDDKELIYEKTRFLSSCFPGITEEELLFLAERMSFFRSDQTGIYSQPSGTVLWSFSDGSQNLKVFVNFNENTDLNSVIRDLRTSYSFCYVLPLNAVREFNFLYPQNSFTIFKYIDGNEE
jgi:hypothetical protein